MKHLCNTIQLWIQEVVYGGGSSAEHFERAIMEWEVRAHVTWRRTRG